MFVSWMRLYLPVTLCALKGNALHTAVNVNFRFYILADLCHVNVNRQNET